jgi:hypothetical protein
LKEYEEAEMMHAGMHGMIKGVASLHCQTYVVLVELFPWLGRELVGVLKVGAVCSHLSF